MREGQGNESNRSLAWLKPGGVIGNRYSIVDRLGSGAFGIVFHCKDMKISRLPIALKIFFPHTKTNSAVMARMVREIRVAHRINHDNIIRFYDPFSYDGLQGYTMEFAKHGDIGKLISPIVTMSEQRLIEILIQVCSGLHALHCAGIVHRDLKPSNLVIGSNGVIKICDFGLVSEGKSISKRIDSLSQIDCKQNLTIAGEFLGTPDYVSPEMLNGSKIDAPSDLYSLGVIAFELLTGKCPFEAENIYSLFEQKMETVAPEVKNKNHNCSDEINEIIAVLLQRNSKDRFQNALALKKELCQLQIKHSKSATSKRTPAEIRKRLRRGPLPTTDISWTFFHTFQKLVGKDRASPNDFFVGNSSFVPSFSNSDSLSRLKLNKSERYQFALLLLLAIAACYFSFSKSAQTTVNSTFKSLTIPFDMTAVSPNKIPERETALPQESKTRKERVFVSQYWKVKGLASPRNARDSLSKANVPADNATTPR